MTIVTVRHRTAYRYANPVRFGTHRLMLRPRDSHDLRLLDTALAIEPAASVRWLHDVFGNSVAIASFSEAGQDLVFDSTIRVEQFPVAERELMLDAYAQRYPFSYPAEEIPDLARTIERAYPDPWHKVDTWARWFVEGDRSRSTLDILTGMTRSIQYQFAYVRREEMGTQTPVQTLESGSGNCRDFALFMMEAVRSLGLAARFVSGYLCSRSLADGTSSLVGGGETHAWVQVYLPGAGWVEFDPTNSLVGGTDLIRVAVTRDPSQAVPVSGTFTGAPNDFLGMSVEVSIAAER
jgi:transglutaminase-like putative cysteine protease